MKFYNLPEVKRLLIPCNLDLKAIIENNPPNFKYNLDFFYCLIDLIYERQMLDKELIGAYVHLDSRILQPLNHEYKPHLQYLVDNKILISNQHYSNTVHFCKSYKFTEQYSKSIACYVEITDKTLLKRLKRYQTKGSANGEDYDYLRKWFFCKDLVFDAEAAEDYSSFLYLKDIAVIKENPETRYNIRVKKIGYLASGEKWFRIDSTAGRLHTNFTNLDKELRRFFSYQGRKLGNIDVGNSQPFLLIEILKETYTSVQQYLTNNYYYSTPTNTNMLVNAQDSELRDVFLYIDLVVHGKLYSHLINEFERAYGQNYFGTGLDMAEKKAILKKEIIFHNLYSKVNSKARGKDLLAKLFPNVINAFNIYKQKDYKRLSVAMQKIEADIIIKKACKKITTEYPDVFIATIHDSIATTEDFKDIVMQVMAQSFKESFGLIPKLNFELWTTDDEDDDTFELMAAA